MCGPEGLRAEEAGCERADSLAVVVEFEREDLYAGAVECGQVAAYAVGEPDAGVRIVGAEAPVWAAETLREAASSEAVSALVAQSSLGEEFGAYSASAYPGSLCRSCSPEGRSPC